MGNAAIMKTKGPLSDRSIRLVISRSKANRLKQTKPWSPDTHLRRSCFAQAFKQLQEKPVTDLRSHCQLWNTILAGERSHDVGGPYREMWEEWTSELQSPALPLLLPSPNQVNDHGPNRDCWVLNPAASSAKELEFFEFLGKLMGCSIRNKLCISLSLAPFVWKVLVNDEITADDIF